MNKVGVLNKAEKNSRLLEKLRWLWCVPSAVMYAATQIPFGRTIAFVLALLFGAAFFIICSRGRMYIISEDIVKDMKAVLKVFGHENSVFEIKSYSFGMVVRVYLIRANLKAPLYSKAVIDKLSKGWYKNMVWMTQIVDISEESDVKRVQKELNAAMIADLEKKDQEERENKKAKKDKK